MKKRNTLKLRKESAGSRIIASLQEAVDWVEGKDIAVRVSTVDVPTIDVRETRETSGPEPGGFRREVWFPASHFAELGAGADPAHGPARVLLAVIARHPEAVEDALRKTS